MIMIIHQKAWFYSIIFLLICLLAAVLIYKFTGNIILVLLVAPPIVHWILKKRIDHKDHP